MKELLGVIGFTLLIAIIVGLGLQFHVQLEHFSEVSQASISNWWTGLSMFFKGFLGTIGAVFLLFLFVLPFAFITRI